MTRRKGPRTADEMTKPWVLLAATLMSACSRSVNREIDVVVTASRARASSLEIASCFFQTGYQLEDLVR